MDNSNYYKANEDLRFKQTTLEEEQELFRKARAGDEASREFLIRNHLLFVAIYARQRNRGKLPDDEIISAVNAALMSAIDRFDPSRGNRFTHYLRPFLRGALASLWRKEKNIVTPPAGSEYPEFVQYEEERREENHLKGKVRIEKQISELSPSTDEIVADEEDLKINLESLSKCRAKLTKSEQELLKLIYDKKISIAQIARDRGVSRQAIWSAREQILGKLRAAFKQ